MDNSIFIGRKVANETKQWLLQNKVYFEEHQLNQIEFNRPGFTDMVKIVSKNKQFVITSQWAAKWLANYYDKVGLKKYDSIFCISEKQKEICNRVSQNVYVSIRQNAQSVADLVLEKNNSGLVVFLRGNQSLNIVESQLYSFRGGFRAIEVYRNLPVPVKVNREFSSYIFFSPSGVKSFYQSGNRISQSSEIIAIGETTAKACSRYFNNIISVSGKQDELSVVKFAVEHLKQSVFYT